MAFSKESARLAGLAGALLGWRPHEFWRATPAELAVILHALSPDMATAPDASLIATLKARFPDSAQIIVPPSC